MNIVKIPDGEKMILKIEGKLDTNTAPELEAVLQEVFNETKDLILDFASLDYISSAGLRVLLVAQKTMNTKGKMTIKNANESLIDIFEVTGFIDILNVEQV